MALKYPPELVLRTALRSNNCPAIQCKRTSATAAAALDKSYLAAVCTELGKPLELISQRRAKLKDNEVRIAIKYAALNFYDLLRIQGKYQEKPVFPLIPGSESAGKVIEVGSDVKSLRPGDHVISLSITGGSYAQELINVEQNVIKIEKEINDTSLGEGASLISSYGTAYMALVRRANVKATDTVLVTAAAGSLGQAMVDIAANVFGAKVIGACGGAEKCKLVQSFGATVAIDYVNENLRDRLKEITSGKGVSIIADVVGGKVLEDSLKNIAYEGQVLTLGYTSGDIPKIPANILLVKNFTMHGVFWGSYGTYMPSVFKDSVQSVVKLWHVGKIKPHIGNTFSLNQANEALQCLANRKTTGKVLLDCENISK